jgi:hypothetical protein
MSLQEHTEKLFDYEILVKKDYEPVRYRNKIVSKLVKESIVLKNDKVIAVFKNKGEAVKYINSLTRLKDFYGKRVSRTIQV